MKECESFYRSTRTGYTRKIHWPLIVCHEYDGITTDGSRAKSVVVFCFCDKLLATIRGMIPAMEEYLDNDDKPGRHTYSRSLLLSLSVLGGDCVLEAVDTL